MSGPDSSEPTPEQFRAATDMFNEVVRDLDVEWTARKPIQGEATPKVFGYRIAKAVLDLLAAHPEPREGERAADEAFAANPAPLIKAQPVDMSVGAFMEVIPSGSLTESERHALGTFGRDGYPDQFTGSLIATVERIVAEHVATSVPAVEGLQRLVEDWLTDNRWDRAYDLSHSIAPLLDAYVAERVATAKAEVAERIALAIEAASGRRFHGKNFKRVWASGGRTGMNIAAAIARAALEDGR